MNKEINFSFGVEFPEEWFAVYCLTNSVSSVRVSLSEKSKDRNLKESIGFRVRTE